MAASTQAGLKDNPAMSFVMLTESQVVPPQPTTNGQPTSQKSKNKGTSSSPSPNPPNFSERVEAAARLFEIVSARSDIDHPICTECTDLLLNALSTRLTTTTKERDAYITFLKTLKNNAPTQSDLSTAKASLKTAQETESKAFTQLLSLEEQKTSLESEIADLEAESLALDAQEQDFWRSRNAFNQKLSSFQNERDALNAAYDHDTQQLERLQRTNVYNDTFCIGHDGFFGTINGLRLGRLPQPQNVEWAEINAAWGVAALLLATVAEKMGFSFRGYRIRPMGSTSKIEKLDYPPSTPSSTTSTTPRAKDAPQPKITPLDLFSSGDLPLGRMLLHRRLDAGMVAFLECLRQLGEFVHKGPNVAPSKPPEARSPGKRRGGGDEEGGTALPYRIQKDKIDDVSIKLGMSTDETWTRACKYVLTCCKFLLAHASNTRDGARRGAS